MRSDFAFNNQEKRIQKKTFPKLQAQQEFPRPETRSSQGIQTLIHVVPVRSVPRRMFRFVD